ncbi:hypothetical protein B7486_44225 [cyanobacterium TDX16]|nr:hypothetical protein B7486_44225 [cyanobacterium TDX16]
MRSLNSLAIRRLKKIAFVAVKKQNGMDLLYYQFLMAPLRKIPPTLPIEGARGDRICIKTNKISMS